MSRKMSNEKSRTSTGYRIPPDVEKKINQLIESGEFDTRADIITTALRFYFDSKNNNLNDEIKQYLTSEEGRRLISDIVGQTDQNRKI